MSDPALLRAAASCSFGSIVAQRQPLIFRHQRPLCVAASRVASAPKDAISLHDKPVREYPHLAAEAEFAGLVWHGLHPNRLSGRQVRALIESAKATFSEQSAVSSRGNVQLHRLAMANDDGVKPIRPVALLAEPRREHRKAPGRPVPPSRRAACGRFRSPRRHGQSPPAHDGDWHRPPAAAGGAARSDARAQRRHASTD